MELSRRSFMSGILAAGCMPAIVRAESLMAVIGFDAAPQQLLLPSTKILTLADTSARVWTVRAHSHAAMEAQMEGLAMLRRFVNPRTGQDQIDYQLERPADRYMRETVKSQWRH